MADYALRITMGDETFTLAHITVQEMAKVQTWTGFKNRRQWQAEIGQEDPNALIAAYVLSRRRRGEDVRFSDVDFDLDSLEVTFVDEAGREVEPLFEKDADGAYRLQDGIPIPVLDGTGEPTWIYTDTGTPVDPTPAASRPTSPTPPTPGNSTEFVSGIPEMSLS